MECLGYLIYVNNVCNKANGLLGFLKRNLHHCLSGLKEMAYKQLILPCLGYCAAVWDPFHHNLINQLEMIQHRAAPFVHGLEAIMTVLLKCFAL